MLTHCRRRHRYSKITVPNGLNSRLMRTCRIRPFRRGGGVGGSPLVPPSLTRPDWWFDYEKSTELSDDHTFTRASTATYTGSDGLVKTAEVDEPRFDHEVYDTGETELGPELITNGGFEAGELNWSLGSSWSIAGGKATTAGVSGSVLKQANVGHGMFAQVEIVISDFVANGGNGRVLLNDASDGSGGWQEFASNGTHVLQGWQTDTDAGGELNIQTIGGATFSVERVSMRELLPVYATRPLGLLIEPASENALEYSADLTQAAWSPISADTGIPPVPEHGYDDPAGGKTATRVRLERTGSGYSGIQQAVGLGGAEAVGSVWLKTADGSTCYVAGRVGNSSTPPILEVTGTWQRFEFTEAVTTSWQFLTRDTYAGTSLVCDLLVWGAQVEVGSAATSYIPTEATAKTRAADICTLDISDLAATEYGPELYTQPFDTVAAQWVDNGDGTYSIDGSQSANANLKATGILPDAGYYEATFEIIERNAGSVRINMGGSSQGTFFAAPGIYTEILPRIGADFYLQGNPTFNGKVRMISCRKVTEGLSMQGTVFTEFGTREATDNRITCIDGGDANTRYMDLRAAATKTDYRMYSIHLGASQPTVVGQNPIDGTQRVAGALSQTDGRIFASGTKGSEFPTTPPLVPRDLLRVGARYDGKFLNGHMKRLQIWGVALDDADLIAITDPDYDGPPDPVTALVTWPDLPAGSAEFDGDDLDAGWERNDGKSGSGVDGSIITVEGGKAVWTYPAGTGQDSLTGDDVAGQGNPFITTPVNGDFDYSFMISNSPLSYVDGNFHGYGFTAFTPSSTSSRWEVYIHSNDDPGANAYTNVGGNGGGETIPWPSISRGFPTHLRLKRTGDVINFSCSFDGINWATINEAAYAGFNPTYLGIYAYQLGDSGFPFVGAIQQVRNGSLDMPTVNDPLVRTPIWTPALNDLSGITDKSARGGSIAAAGGVLTLNGVNQDASGARFEANGVEIPADCGVLFKCGVTLGATAYYLGVQLRANSWRGVDWTSPYGPPIGQVTEIHATTPTQRVLSIHQDAPSLADGGYWNFVNERNILAPDASYIWHRFEAIGPIMRCRTWQDGNQEPATWDFEWVDDTVTDAGGFGMAFSKNVGSGVDSFATMEISDMEVYALSQGPTTLTGETAGFVIETPQSKQNSQFIDPDGPGGDQLEIEGESPSYFGTAGPNELVLSFGSAVAYSKVYVKFSDKTPTIEMTEFAPGDFFVKIPGIQGIMAQLRGNKIKIKYAVAT